MHLAAQGALGRQEQVLGQLLGDRTAALDHVIGLQVGHHGAQGALEIETEMFVEPRIFGGQHRIDQVRRDFIERYGVILPDTATPDHGAVGVGEGDRILPAALPDSVILEDRRQGVEHQPHGEDQAECGAVGHQIDQHALQAVDLEPSHERGVRAVGVAQPLVERVTAGIDPAVEVVEQLGELAFWVQIRQRGCSVFGRALRKRSFRRRHTQKSYLVYAFTVAESWRSAAHSRSSRRPRAATNAAATTIRAKHRTRRKCARPQLFTRCT